MTKKEREQVDRIEQKVASVDRMIGELMEALDAERDRLSPRFVKKWGKLMAESSRAAKAAAS